MNVIGFVKGGNEVVATICRSKNFVGISFSCGNFLEKAEISNGAMK